MEIDLIAAEYQLL